MGLPPPPRAPESPWRSDAVGGGWQGRVCTEAVATRSESDRLSLECPAVRGRFPRIETRDGAAPFPADQHALSSPDERRRWAAAVACARQCRRGGEESRGRRSRRRPATPRRAARRRPLPARPPWAVRVIASPPPAPLAQRRARAPLRGRRVPARGAPQRFGGAARHRHVYTERAHGLVPARGEAAVVGRYRLCYRAQGGPVPYRVATVSVCLRVCFGYSVRAVHARGQWAQVNVEKACSTHTPAPSPPPPLPSPKSSSSPSP